MAQQHFWEVCNLDVNKSSNFETGAACGCTLLKVSDNCYRLRSWTVRKFLRDAKIAQKVSKALENEVCSVNFEGCKNNSEKDSEMSRR